MLSQSCDFGTAMCVFLLKGRVVVEIVWAALWVGGNGRTCVKALCVFVDAGVLGGELVRVIF